MGTATDKAFTILDKPVLEALDGFHKALYDSRSKGEILSNYTVNGGMAVQSTMAYALTSNGGNLGDITNIPGLKKTLRPTSDIDVSVSNADGIVGVYSSSLGREYIRDTEMGRNVRRFVFDRNAPDLDVHSVDDEFHLRMIDESRNITLRHKKDEYTFRVPKPEYIVALKLFDVRPESKHFMDAQKLKAFERAGLLKVDEDILGELLELRFRSRAKLETWQGL